MIQGRRIRFGVPLASAMCAILSITALASDSVTRVLTTATPNLPESIAVAHRGTTYVSFPFAGQVKADLIDQLSGGGIDWGAPKRASVAHSSSATATSPCTVAITNGKRNRSENGFSAGAV